MSRRLIVILLIIFLIPAFFIGGAIMLLSSPEVYRDQLRKTFANQTGLDIEIGGETRWRYFPPLALSVGGVTLSPLGEDAPLARIGKVDVDLRLWRLLLGGEVAINGLTIDGVEVNAIIDEAGNANWETGELSGAGADDPSAQDGSPMALDIHQIRLREIVVNYQDRQNGSDYTVTLPRLTASTPVYGEATSLIFELNLQDNASGLMAETSGDGFLTVDPGFSRLRFEGLLEQNLEAPGLQPIASRLTVDGEYDSEAAKLEASIVGTFTGTDPDVARPAKKLLPQDSPVDPLSGSDIEGTFDITTGDLLDVNFDLTIGTLDLDTIFRATAEAEAETDAASTEDMEVLPLDTLRAMNINGELKVASINFGTYDFSELVLAVANADDQLSATAAMKGYDGTLNVRFTGTTAGNGAGQTSVQLSAVNIEQMTGAEAISGHVNLNSNTTFTGNMLSDVFATLDGRTEFDVSDGTIDVRPIKRLALIVDALRGQESGVGAWPDRMPFEQLTGQHRFIDGTTADQQFNVDLKLLEASGTGGFDYVDGTIGYDIILSFNETEGQFSVGPGLARLDWPMRCRGEFGQTMAQLCFGDERAIQRMLQDVARQEIERKGEEKLREQIREALPEELRESAEGMLRNLIRRDN